MGIANAAQTHAAECQNQKDNDEADDTSGSS